MKRFYDPHKNYLKGSNNLFKKTNNLFKILFVYLLTIYLFTSICNGYRESLNYKKI